MNNTRLSVVVGGQYGSEAKGHVVQRLAERAVQQGRMPHTIRVAGPNAGHTGYDATGRAWALRQVPVAAVVPGQAMIGIAPGSEIDPAVLYNELRELGEAGLLHDKTIWISSEATCIMDTDKEAETGIMASETETNLVRRIGSTGKGIGSARANRAMRTAPLLRDYGNAIEHLTKVGVQVVDAYPSNFSAIPSTHTIIEGTQGYALGTHAGHYPQVTSSDCRAIDFLAMAGVSPWQWRAEDFEVWVVARIYPIRVAGNSGPMKDETTWAALGLPKERTTVTKKVRRVGAEDWELVREAAIANGGKRVNLAITMLDQKFPITRDQDPRTVPNPSRDEISRYLFNVQRDVGARIGLVTTGPNSAHWL